eukprot:snap_masked-scaffold1665_size31760-processed-gene-0.1 protein:Tk06808 transcript:snap_masked-scaffold1665_size31760-processed-gene-0.1-mRNA-1 annotation:"PREDICTED: uncharacterized protein K02A2.6-like"
MHIYLKEGEEVKPTHVTVTRNIPYAYRVEAEKELKFMEESSIIEPVLEPTDWVSPCLVVPKPNKKVRLVVNFKGLNKAIQTNKQAALPTSLLVNGTATVGSDETAQAMNHFFIDKVDKLHQNLAHVSAPSSDWPASYKPFLFSFASAEGFARFAAGNGLIMNASKTQLMLGGKVRRVDLQDFHVVVDGVTVFPDKKLELLGVKFDSTSSTFPHGASVSASAT